MALNQNHLDNYTINISLDARTLAGADFSTPALIADEANGTTLNSARFAKYATSTELAADFAAGYLSSAVYAAGLAAFTQATRPAEIIIGRKAAAETYAEALAAMETAGADLYGIALESRASADIALMDTTINARDDLVLMVQNDDSEIASVDWAGGTALTDTVLSAIRGSERTFLCWHDDDTEWMDFAYLANRLAWDPDVQSPSWDAPVDAVANYTSVLSTTQKGFLDSNFANHGLALGGELFHVDAGVSLAGRPIYEIYTRDWFKTRLQEGLAKLKTSQSRAGVKIPVDLTGQGLVLAVCEAVLAAGSSGKSPHFLPGQTYVTPYAITDADRDAQRLRFKGNATFAVSARKFTFDLNFSRSLVFA